MPTRPSALVRDLDYGNVGKVGRRTGITLAPRKRDEHGLEEMTGLFSSPEKPISKDVYRSREETAAETPLKRRAQPQTPPTRTSARRSIRNSARSVRSVRSVSPRKSGISGTARRSGAVDVLGQSQPILAAENQLEFAQRDIDERTERTEVSEEEEQEAPGVKVQSVVPKDAEPSAVQPTTTPIHTARAKLSTVRPATVRRFSPERTPLRNHIMRKSKSAYIPRISDVQHSAEVTDTEVDEPIAEGTPTRSNVTIQVEEAPADLQEVLQIGNDDADIVIEGNVDNEHGDVEDAPLANVDSPGGVNDITVEDQIDPAEITEESEDELEPPPLPPILDDEDEDQTFDLSMLRDKKRGLNKANSRRKRKSDLIEEDRRIESSPAAKRAKRKADSPVVSAPKETISRPSKSKTTRPALAKKDKNTQLSQRRQEELNDVVQKIRARPGPKKSLFVLRRETPTDDTVARTRSGRVTIKPVAWWRNEGIEYDAGDGTGAGIGDGWKFPMRSIKQVIRQEEKVPTPRPTKRRGMKGGRKKAAQQAGESELSDSEYEDPNADDWELDTGTLTAPMGIWDPELQACADEEEDTDIAHAAGAIETKEVKSQGFKYAKLISQTFFGVGIVDLPAGATKRAKNSRKMHMSFFVFKGRVTVQTGPIQGPETTFSIGKGGFWHVPRGNNYSIQNEHDKQARIFFSQACDTAPPVEEEE